MFGTMQEECICIACEYVCECATVFLSVRVCVIVCMPMCVWFLGLNIWEVIHCTCTITIIS